MNLELPSSSDQAILGSLPSFDEEDEISFELNQLPTVIFDSEGKDANLDSQPCQSSQETHLDQKSSPKVHKKVVKRNHTQKKKKRVPMLFTRDEDIKILKMVLEDGPRFQTIGYLFPGKTLSMVKNRYYKNLRYRWDEVMGIEYIYLNQPKEDQFLKSVQDLKNTLGEVPNFQEGSAIMAGFVDKLTAFFTHTLY